MVAQLGGELRTGVYGAGREGVDGARPGYRPGHRFISGRPRPAEKSPAGK